MVVLLMLCVALAYIAGAIGATCDFDKPKTWIIVCIICIAICISAFFAKKAVINHIITDYEHGEIVLYDGTYQYMPIDYD